MSGGNNHFSNIWPHERIAFFALLNAGYKVRLVPSDNHSKSPDFNINGRHYELKSPKGKNISCVTRNIKRAKKQSPNIIVDTSRIKNLRDRSIVNFIRNDITNYPGLKHLLIITKNRDVIVIV